MALFDSVLTFLLQTLEPELKKETNPLLRILGRMSVVPALTVSEEEWAVLQPAVVSTEDLPGVCWLLLKQQTPGYEPETNLLPLLEQRYRQELLTLLEGSDPALCLRTALLLNYFCLSAHQARHPEADRQFFNQLPVEAYLNRISEKPDVPLTFLDGLTPLSITLARLCQSMPISAHLTAAVSDWLMNLTGLIRQYLLPVQTNEHLYSFFPTAICRPDRTCETSQQLTWGSGDLNQVFLFRAAAPLLGDATLLTLAQRVGEFTTFRRERTATEVTDTRFGRGTAGLVMMYDLLYRETGDNSYNEARTFWLRKTVSLLVHTHNPTPSSFLDGVVGTFIALQATSKPNNQLAPVLFLN